MRKLGEIFNASIRGVVTPIKKVVKPTATAEDVIADLQLFQQTAMQAPAPNSPSTKEEMEKLDAMGFGSSTSVSNGKIEIQEAEEEIKAWEAAEHYHQYYPQNPFLSEKQVKKICEKYGLVYAEASLYRGEIPERVMNLLTGFKVRNRDLSIQGRRIVDTLSWIQGPEDRSLNTLPDKQIAEVVGGYRKVYRKGEAERAKTTQYYVIAKEGEFQSSSVQSAVENFEFKLIDPDPIVLARVNCGFLVVAAWGEEATFPEIQSPEKN